MKKYLLLIPIVFFSVSLPAQQLAQYNLYHFNLDLINPAATGYLPCKTFTITDRHQWIGIEGAPSIQSLSIQLPKQFHKYKKYGLGLNLVRDVNGATQNLGGEILYAYHLSLGGITTKQLSFGLSGKFGQYIFDEREFTEGLYDPIIGRTVNTEWYYNFSSGIFLYSENYFTGIGVYNLVPRTTNFYREYGNESYFVTFIGGYNFKPQRNNFLLTSSIYLARGTDFFQADVNNHIYFQNGLSAGLTLRKYFGNFYHSGQNALLYIGYKLDNWDLAYTYDIGINNLQRNHLGSNQFSVTYTLCTKKYACPTY